MRRHVVGAIALLVTIGFMASCEGDVGPAGPAGPQGPQGETGADGPPGNPGVETFTANLNEANVVGGGTGSAATGVATFAVVGQTLLYNVSVTGLTDVTRMHIHGPAGVDANAGVVQSLCVDDDAPPCAPGTVNGVLVAGAAPRSRIPFDSLLVLMRNGNAYVNVHTVAFPGGEIRGQVTSP